MKDFLLYLYSISTSIFAVSLFAFPLAIYYLTLKATPKAIGVIGLTTISLFFGMTCFIPLVLPENHHYDILPNFSYVFLGFSALLFCLFQTRDQELEQKFGEQE